MRGLVPALLVVLAVLAGCGADDPPRRAAPADCGALRFATSSWMRLEDRSPSARRRELGHLLTCVRTSVGRTLRAQRQTYVDAARWIADWGRVRVVRGERAVRVARDAVAGRNRLKAAARRLAPPHLRRLAEERNRRRYGNPLGPGYEDLVREGGTPAQIIAGAGRTNRQLNELLGMR